MCFVLMDHQDKRNAEILKIIGKIEEHSTKSDKKRYSFIKEIRKIWK